MKVAFSPQVYSDIIGLVDILVAKEWLESNNRVEIVVGEPYQLKFNCSDNSLILWI